MDTVTKNIMIVGVGGQGSLLASKLLGHLLCAEGYDVKVSEVHGMSQRGGSVVTYVRYGDRVAAVVTGIGKSVRKWALLRQNIRILSFSCPLLRTAKRSWICFVISIQSTRC